MFEWSPLADSIELGISKCLDTGKKQLMVGGGESFKRQKPKSKQLNQIRELIGPYLWVKFLQFQEWSMGLHLRIAQAQTCAQTLVYDKTLRKWFFWVLPLSSGRRSDDNNQATSQFHCWAEFCPTKWYIAPSTSYGIHVYLDVCILANILDYS